MTHPASALLAAGRIPDAIVYLRECGDHPAALALLEAGFTDYAGWVLDGAATSTGRALGAAQGSGRCHAAAGGAEGPQHAETPVSGHVGGLPA
jgi:hypothetical protein